MQRAAIVEAVEDRQVSLMELEQRLGSAAEQERQQWHHDVEQLETQLRESEADRLLNGNRVGRLEREVEKLQNQLNAEKRSVAKQDGLCRLYFSSLFFTFVISFLLFGLQV
jgi:septal ring factor EnvC (AmiA/AmiB activator)